MRWAAGAERTCGKVAAGGLGEEVAGGAGGPASAYGQTGRNTCGERQTTQPRVPAQGNKTLKPLTKQICGD